MDARETSIMAHPKVASGNARDFGRWLVTKTRLSVSEAFAALDKLPKSGPSKQHPSRHMDDAPPSYELPVHEQLARYATPSRPAPPTTPRESPVAQRQREEQAHHARLRAEVEAANIKAQRDFAVAQNRMTPDQETWCRMNGFKTTRSAPPERSPAQQDQDNAIASLARNYRAIGADEDEAHSPAFGVSASTDNRLYSTGAETAARLLGRDAPRLPSESAMRASPVSRTPAAGGIDPALYAQGEAAARQLIGFGSLKAEIDADLQRNFAEQQPANRS
jgi:hypothetical protein